MNEIFSLIRKAKEFVEKEFQTIHNTFQQQGDILMTIQDQITQLQQAIADLDAKALAQATAVQTAINALNTSVQNLTVAANATANLPAELTALIASVQKAASDVDAIYVAPAPVAPVVAAASGSAPVASSAPSVSSTPVDPNASVAPQATTPAAPVAPVVQNTETVVVPSATTAQ